MSQHVKCNKCKNFVELKRTALCSNCKKRYEFDCIGYPEKTYRLMNREEKKKWRCKECIKTYSEKDATNDGWNITTRKKHHRIVQNTTPDQQHITTDDPHYVESPCPSVYHHNTSLDSHILTDYNQSSESFTTPKLSRSLDGTFSDTTALTEMKNTLTQLTSTLESTQNELENVILENNDLRRQINKLMAENKTLKTLCSSPAKILNSPKSIHLEKSKIRSLVHNSLTSSSSSPSAAARSKDNIHTTVSYMQQEIDYLKKQLKTKEKEPISSILTNTNKTIDMKNDPSKTPNAIVNDIKYDLRKIHIFGSQQCAGLAKALSQSRENTAYEKYKITGEIKPQAPSYEIIKNCLKTKLNLNDKLIINIGENDYDIRLILSQLQVVLETFYNNKIIVLYVNKNRYVNVYKLNHRLKLFCKRYKNCEFLNFEHYSPFDLICKSINYIIDCTDYANKYLNPKELKRRIVNNMPVCKKTSPMPKKGTIPFYFSKLTDTRICKNVCKNNQKQNNKKGTIPYYFHATTKKNTFFRP